MEDISRSNVEAYNRPETLHSPLLGAEEVIFREYLRADLKVLDLGCGDGRVTSALLKLKVNVTACDLNAAAVSRLKSALGGNENLNLEVADARALQFADKSFDFVIFAFNGLDYLHPASDRRKAIEEMARVTRVGGHCAFSSHNSIGALFSPRNLTSLHTWCWRISRLFRGELTSKYFRNPGGLLLHQATPSEIIAETIAAAPLEFVEIFNRTGGFRSRSLLSVLSAWPYYLFRRKTEQC